jgi:membrane-associated phospholipid phosphatase
MVLVESTIDSSVDQAVEAEPVDVRARRWALVRRWLTVGYFIALALCVAFVGVPEGRESLLAWALTALGIRCLGRSWRSFGRALRDWLPYTALLIVYDYTRGMADHLGFHIHLRAPARADMWLFHGTLPTYWLQQHLFVAGVPQWYDGFVTLVYTSHFLVTPIVAVVLWMYNRSAWLSFIARSMTLSMLGLATYILYPSAPPWYAANFGVIDPVVRLSSRGFSVLGIPHAGTLLTSGQATVNDVAAMPSLHTATATIIALYFIPKVPWWGKIPLACYPLAMGFVLVYSGEHYVVDVLFGYLYGVVITVAAVLIERWWKARRQVAAAPSELTALAPVAAR